MKEIIDIHSQSCNIILYNLPESDKKSDESQINDIFKCMETKITNFSFACLDKLSTFVTKKP